MSTNPRIAIAGGGCSGALVAVQLLRAGFRGQLTLIEPRERLGTGLAYSTPFERHLLNVPAARMSALPSEPSHFLDWLRAGRWAGAEGDWFAPRQEYGLYLESLLQQTIQASANATCTHIRAEAAEVNVDEGEAFLTLTNGAIVRAPKVVLALGNPASSPVDGHSKEGLEDRWHDSPWFGDALRVRYPGERILLLGTGLTAVDSLVALHSEEYSCKVYMLSRRGLLPEVHDVRPSSGVPLALPTQGQLRELFHGLRERIKAARQDGFNWRDTIDGLRPVSNDIWRQLAVSDKQRFFRHLKTYWEQHRHRMAPEIRVLINEYLADGRLEILAGRTNEVRTCDEGLKVRIQSRNGKESILCVDRVISCTGIHENYAERPRPLARALMEKGLARPNDLGIGFATDRNGALLDAGMCPSSVFFTIGPPRRGELFETTAVPELRVQAEELALYLLAS